VRPERWAPARRGRAAQARVPASASTPARGPVAADRAPPCPAGGAAAVGCYSHPSARAWSRTLRQRGRGAAGGPRWRSRNVRRTARPAGDPHGAWPPARRRHRAAVPPIGTDTGRSSRAPFQRGGPGAVDPGSWAGVADFLHAHKGV